MNEIRVSGGVLNLCIIGCGYVGLTCATCFSRLGNKVICLDNDQAKIELLKRGKSPIHEPYLQEFLSQAKDKLFFTTEPSAMEPAEAIFIAVSTPVSREGKWDLNQIEEVAKSIGRNIKSYKLIINKCTTPVGTTEKIAQLITGEGAPPSHFDVISNPEFLREGSAISDFLHPHRIVIGGSNHKATELLLQLYQPIIEQNFPFSPPASNPPPTPTIITTTTTAEMMAFGGGDTIILKTTSGDGNSCSLLSYSLPYMAGSWGRRKREGFLLMSWLFLFPLP